MVATSGPEIVGQPTGPRLRAARYPAYPGVLPWEYYASRVTSTDTSMAVAEPPEYVPLSGDTSA